MRLYVFHRVCRSMALVALVCMALATAASLVRVLPWLTAANVPWRASAAFSAALALAALEVALLVAPAVGASLELARCASDGSLVALESIGFGPPRILRQVAQAALIAAALSSSASGAWGVGARRPGIVSNQILTAGGSACESNVAAQVPLASDLTWLCLDNRPALVGRFGPASAMGVWAASKATFSDDLLSISADDVRVATRSPVVTATFAHVTVTGFVPWLVASPVAAFARALACALACLASTVAASWVLLRRPTPSRAAALAIGCAGPGAFLALAPGLLVHHAVAGTLAAVLIAAAAPLVVASGLFHPLLLARLRGGGTP